MKQLEPVSLDTTVNRNRNLTKAYGKFKALDHLALKLEGQVCGSPRPERRGKTTTLKMATDMIFPTEGPRGPER
jgi:ABC-type multidrug transport system ATPase subunit